MMLAGRSPEKNRHAHTCDLEFLHLQFSQKIFEVFLQWLNRNAMRIKSAKQPQKLEESALDHNMGKN